MMTGNTAAAPAAMMAFGSVTPARYTAKEAAKKDRAQLAAIALNSVILFLQFCYQRSDLRRWQSNFKVHFVFAIAVIATPN